MCQNHVINSPTEFNIKRIFKLIKDWLNEEPYTNTFWQMFFSRKCKINSGNKNYHLGQLVQNYSGKCHWGKCPLNHLTHHGQRTKLLRATGSQHFGPLSANVY